MPTEDPVTISMNPEARANVERLAERAAKAGKPFPMCTRMRRTGRRKVEPVEEVRLSPVVHAALAHAVESMTFAPPAKPEPAPQATPPADDVGRLKAAIVKSGLSIPEIARKIGCERSTIHQAAKGKPALAVAAGGALLAWVESVERG